MDTHGVVPGHVVATEGLQVDKAKIDITTSLPYP